MPHWPHLHRSLARPLSTLLAAGLAAILLSTALPPTDALAGTGAKPTIVFVHGAFADA